MIPENASEEALGELVNVRNTTRSCLSFRVPGQSVLIMPGQSIDLPINFLYTHELSALARQGSAIAVKPVEAHDVATKDDSVDSGNENIPQDDGVGRNQQLLPQSKKISKAKTPLRNSRE